MKRRKKRRKNKKIWYWTGFFTALVFSFLGWTFYKILNLLSERSLSKFGITDPLWQNIILFVILIILLLLIGYGFKKIFNKLIK